MAQFMQALKKFKYARVAYNVGDILEVKSRHAVVLSHAGLAKVVDVETYNVYQTREMEAKKPSVMTVLELRAEAEKRGIHLPRGFIAKKELLNIIEKA